MDKEKLYELAARAAGCKETEVMAAAIRDNGVLVVVVYPGPKYKYSPEVVAELMAPSGMPKRAPSGMPKRHQDDLVDTKDIKEPCGSEGIEAEEVPAVPAKKRAKRKQPALLQDTNLVEPVPAKTRKHTPSGMPKRQVR